MTISIIVAVSDNGVIGKDGKIPWRLSTDLARFKDITIGSFIVMGRKTFESIGKPLKDRDNIVISKDHEKLQNEAWGKNVMDIDFCSMDEALGFMKLSQYSDSFIIGGQHIYDEIFKTPELIHRVYLTRVHCNVEGDTFFKHEFPKNPHNYAYPDPWWWDDKRNVFIKWKLISEEFIPKSDKDEYDSTFQVWENRS